MLSHLFNVPQDSNSKIHILPVGALLPAFAALTAQVPEEERRALSSTTALSGRAAEPFLSRSIPWSSLNNQTAVLGSAHPLSQLCPGDSRLLLREHERWRLGKAQGL